MNLSDMKKAGRKSKQLELIRKIPKHFGGSLLKGNPRHGRPLNGTSPIHLVLKAENGFGVRSMLHPKHVDAVNRCVRKNAEKYGVRIYHFVNVGNHLHLIVKITQRRGYGAFIRTVSGLIARQILGRERGKALGKSLRISGMRKKRRSGTAHRYWLKRPFTRIASWGRDYNALGQYMIKNQNQVKYWGLKSGERFGKVVYGFDFGIKQDTIRSSA